MNKYPQNLWIFSCDKKVSKNLEYIETKKRTLYNENKGGIINGKSCY